MATHQDLLARHLPVIRYDRFEPYFATGIDAFLSAGASEDIDGAVELLRNGEAEPFAAIGGDRPPRDAIAAIRDGAYDDGRPCDAKDQLRLTARRGTRVDYRRDGALLQEAAGHVLHGRAVERSDGVWLQYWFFHYANDRIQPSSGALIHEGDWEMVQLRVPFSAGPGSPLKDHPDHVTFSQHIAAARRSWWNIEKRDGLRPVVYPGRGTHALYPRRGWRGTWALDIRDGGYEVADADLVILAEDDPLVAWPGLWGGHPGSPTGLATRTAWRTPEVYHEEAVGLIRGGIRAALKWLRNGTVAAGQRIRRAVTKPKAIADEVRSSRRGPARSRRDEPVAGGFAWPWTRGRRSITATRDASDPSRVRVTVTMRDFGWSLSTAYLIVRITPEGRPHRVYTWPVDARAPGEPFRFVRDLPWRIPTEAACQVEVLAVPSTCVGQLRVGAVRL